MIFYLKKLNFLIGLLLVLVFIFIGSIAENLTRKILKVMQNIFYYFDYFDINGGYFGMFYEKLLLEGAGTFVYFSVALCGPIFLNKKLFSNIKINWIPSFLLIFIHFFYTGYKMFAAMSFDVLINADWIDMLSLFIILISYLGGFSIAMLFSAKYAEINHPLINKFLK